MTCSMATCTPRAAQPGLFVSTTTPAAIAWIGLPYGASKSTPSCTLEHPAQGEARGPKPEPMPVPGSTGHTSGGGTVTS